MKIIYNSHRKNFLERISSFCIIKITLLIHLILSTSLPTIAQGRWEIIESPTNNFLRRITFSDTNTIWASGHNGTIIKSTNQGLSWTVLPTNTNNIIMNHSAVNNDLIFAITWEFQNPPYGTYLIKSTNGGFNWQSQFFPIQYEYLQSIHFFNENVGIVAGSRTYITTNGGLSWTQAQRDSDLVANLPFLNIKMLNNNYGFACGGFIDVAGVIWKTTNGGSTWKTNGISPDEIFDMVVLDSLNIIALSGDPEFIYNLAFVKSTDGGENWTYTELPFYAVSLGIDARDYNNIWSAAGFRFIYTTNGGNDWMSINTPDSVSVYDLVFINNQKGFACGENGVLLKFIADESGVQEDKSTPQNFYLYQNYPNPFNPSTVISYQLPVNGRVSLKVYDILGNEIATLVDEYKEAGRYEVEFNVGQAISLSTGVYIYQLKVGEYTASRKMLLMK